MPPIPTAVDVLVLGAGAAGLMCAIEAGRRGRRVVVLDQSAQPAEKIRISGGGRCNFTNLHTTPANFLSANPRFCVSALRRYGPPDFIALVKKHGIAFHEKTLGQLFCDGRSQQIIDMLLSEAAAAGVVLRLGQTIRAIAKPDDRFAVETDAGRLTATALVVATGGPSIPKMGSSGFGYEVARQFGLAVIVPRPALVPLTFTADLLHWTRALAGVSVEAEVRFDRTRFAEGLLFTHRGLSGPSILQKRLAESIVAATGIAGRLADLGDARIRLVADRVNRWRVVPSGTEGYRTAEVTLGGIDTAGLSSKTMEATAVPGLYFIGEVVDVTGHLGGFNFQWAWASGHAAGQFV